LAIRRALLLYSHRNSPKKFTQHQLFACLVLKNFLRTDYRGKKVPQVIVAIENPTDFSQRRFIAVGHSFGEIQQLLQLLTKTLDEGSSRGASELSM
jgi:hypothetical protein